MKISQFYSKKVLEHVRHPRNMGEIKNPDGMATVGNKICGDIMRLYIKIEKKNGKEYIK
ncbi:iron-sulfur cluster assembly scaffold protein, partial [Patescibacteria group bacterium]|nr:iron-sulfur cluster assembly scaffold protein [Patescibacteria group bacterium]